MSWGACLGNTGCAGGYYANCNNNNYFSQYWETPCIECPAGTFSNSGQNNYYSGELDVYVHRWE